MPIQVNQLLFFRRYQLPMPQTVRRFRLRLRRLIRKSWFLSRCYYRYRGARLRGRPRQEVWYFAYGANMDDGTFRARRGIQALECRPGRIQGYRLRFNLDGRPRGKAAPANLHPDPGAEVWGVLYRITRRDLLHLDSTEGVPGRGYRHIEIAAEGRNRRVSRPSRTWLRVMRWMESRRCGTSLYCGMAREPTDCPRPTSDFWRASSTCSE